jgi:hypothetical protein
VSSKDYAEGFKDGFIDYLQFGGSGQPPYAPPKRYWGPNYRTPEGYRAIEDWFAGFRHGVTAAKESGYRPWVTLPSASTTVSGYNRDEIISSARKTIGLGFETGPDAAFETTAVSVVPASANK